MLMLKVKRTMKNTIKFAKNFVFSQTVHCVTYMYGNAYDLISN